ncbi:MAG TPA: polysaccharide biosynthesis tyrosine autokinase [Ideonella sp.]|uniref:polysaccharide biosynthesis tyrosine autokinase n=1 Tax=Ideonella sp. TaxID=1929293 RepID=UPI002C1756BE|nr:polysaccharide biosynthesis tyrosine autokinase [Ideonella sp.]HSI50570.1 polysaccharide biosynthesis tyrosine autokinase [Ideonella sp.]
MNLQDILAPRRKSARPMPSDAEDGTPSHTPADGTRTLGEILAELRQLSPEQIEQVGSHQRQNGLRFGEAAIELGLVSHDDVLRALSLQFNYAYGSAESQRLSPELVALNQPFGHQAEAFRMIRSQLQLRLGNAEGAVRTRRRALAVVSPNSDDGKTYFCANLAVALSQLGQRTLVVDADLRGPRLHEVFGVPNDLGLSGLLSGRHGDTVIKPVPGVPDLFVCPAGTRPPNPLELLERPAFGLLMHELQQRFDHVIVDTPAAEYGADALVISARCGQALVLARKHASQVATLQELSASLSAANTTLTGVVMNDR